MEIEFTAHAVTRMQERKIGVREVEKIIGHPDGAISQSKNKVSAYKHFKRRKDNMIAVVAVRKPEGGYKVVTVMVHFEVKHENNSRQRQ